MARKLNDKDSEYFKNLCNGLLECVTPEAYERTQNRMDEFITDGSDGRAFLKSWINWWHERRGFIFRALAPSDAPNMNQAEVIHVGWVHRDLPNLSLLDACHADVRDSLKLDVELKAFESGTGSGGSGPSYIERKNKEFNHHRTDLQTDQCPGKNLVEEEKNIDHTTYQNYTDQR